MQIAKSDVPSSWHVTKVGDAGQVTIGQQKRPQTADLESSPYLRVANVQDDQLDLREIARMPISDPERYLLRAGDILLCEGQSRELVGRAAMYHGELSPIYFQNHLIRFRANPEVDPEYALFVFRAYQKLGLFASVAKATTGIANLGLGRFRNLAFMVPPLTIQRDIATTARAFQDQIDLIRSTVETCSTVLATLAPKATDQIILGSDEQSWIGGTIGRSPWPVREACEVVEHQSPIVYGILQPGPDVAGGVPYIRGQDLQQFHIVIDQLKRTSEAVASKYSRSRLIPGDVLLGIIRSTRVAVVPEQLAGANITQGTARLRPGPDIEPWYLAHWLSSRAAQSWLTTRMRGIDMPGLNLKDVRATPIPVPPIAVQQELVEQLNAINLHVDVVRQAAESMKSILRLLEMRGLATITHANLAVDASGTQPLDSNIVGIKKVKGDVTPLPRAKPNTPVATARPSGAVTTSAESLMMALRALNGSATPEELFSQLKLAEEAVDSYYIALRDLVRNGQVRTQRPNNTDVLIELS